MLQEQDRVAGIKVCGWRGVAVWLSWQAVLECIVTGALQSSPLDSLASYSYLFSIISEGVGAEGDWQLINKDVEPRGDFFENPSGQNPPFVPKGEPLPWDLQHVLFFCLLLCRHTASPAITSGTHTGGVQ